MIKANAYGHGAAWCAEVLAQQSAIYAFGVATVEEGIELREKVKSIRDIPVMVFADCAPWDKSLEKIFRTYRLRPILGSYDSFRHFIKLGSHQRIDYDLKFNTGLNRLGIDAIHLDSVIRFLQSMQPNYYPKTVLTHLALSDRPEHPTSRKQLKRWIAIRSAFKKLDPHILFHFGNTATLWNANEWNLFGLSDLVRPGIGLYGIPPWSKLATRLRPVLSLRAKIIRVEKVTRPETVGYGGHFKATQKGSWIATVSLGYADGLPRQLQSGTARVRDRVCHVAGTISMDLVALHCTFKPRVGDWAYWISPKMDLWDQAIQSNTVPYHLFTSLASRVKRIHE